MTTYRLGDIQPNPFRNIDRYPINREKVDALKASIGRTDFWDNLVARIGTDGKPEIGYGHHRLVALRELFTPDHEISLIVRDLDDEDMLHIMADENMTEWAATSAIAVETVRAVRDFLAISGPARKLGNAAKPNGVEDIVAFLGWPANRVENALSILTAEEGGILDADDTSDMPLETATVMRHSVARIKDPVVRREAIKRVRADIAQGGGKRGIPNVVREVRDRMEPVTNPIPPRTVARDVHGAITGFFDAGTTYSTATGSRLLTRAEIIELVAANRDAEEFKSVGPLNLADQMANALDKMADQATRYAALLRNTPALVTAGRNK